MNNPEKLLDIRSLAEWLGMGTSTLYHMMARREIPFIRVGRLARFEKTAIDKWLADRKVMPVNQ